MIFFFWSENDFGSIMFRVNSYKMCRAHAENIPECCGIKNGSSVKCLDAFRIALTYEP